MSIFIPEDEIEQAFWDILSSALKHTELYGSVLEQTYIYKAMKMKLNNNMVCEDVGH